MRSAGAAVTDAEILSGVAEVARTHLRWEGPLVEETRLVEDLGLDSLKLLTLAVEVENHFRVCLDVDDEGEIETVADLLQAIRRQLAP